MNDIKYGALLFGGRVIFQVLNFVKGYVLLHKSMHCKGVNQEAQNTIVFMPVNYCLKKSENIVPSSFAN